MASNPLIPHGYRYHKALIEQIAKAHGLDPVLVAAVCWQESAFNADAFRHEPAFWNRYLKHKPAWNQRNPRRVSSSYGLMQVMFTTAVEDGSIFPEANPEDLFVPEVGLRAGCRHLHKLVVWASALDLTEADRLKAALASYNGGRGSNDKPPFRNGKYANEVLHKLSILRA